MGKPSLCLRVFVVQPARTLAHAKARRNGAAATPSGAGHPKRAGNFRSIDNSPSSRRPRSTVSQAARPTSPRGSARTLAAYLTSGSAEMGSSGEKIDELFYAGTAR